MALPLCVLIFSCNKSISEKTTETTTSSLTNATQQVINAGTLQGVKQSYLMLSANEKQTLWNLKWAAILKNDGSRLSEEQIKIIESIKAFVDRTTIASLVKNPAPDDNFIKKSLVHFQAHFSNDQLYIIIECPYYCDNFSLFNSMAYLRKIDTNLPTDEEVGGDSGTKCTCYYSIYCSLGGGGGGTCNKDKNPCEKVAECGLSGTSNCNGTCG